MQKDKFILNMNIWRRVLLSIIYALIALSLQYVITSPSAADSGNTELSDLARLDAARTAFNCGYYDEAILSCKDILAKSTDSDVRSETVAIFIYANGILHGTESAIVEAEILRAAALSAKPGNTEEIKTLDEIITDLEQSAVAYRNKLSKEKKTLRKYPGTEQSAQASFEIARLAEQYEGYPAACIALQQIAVDTSNRQSQKAAAEKSRILDSLFTDQPTISSSSTPNNALEMATLNEAINDLGEDQFEKAIKAGKNLLSSSNPEIRLGAINLLVLAVQRQKGYKEAMFELCTLADGSGLFKPTAAERCDIAQICFKLAKERYNFLKVVCALEQSIVQHSDTEQAASTALSIARLMRMEGSIAESLWALQRVANDYPDTPQAVKARQSLDTINSDAKKFGGLHESKFTAWQDASSEFAREQTEIIRSLRKEKRVSAATAYRMAETASMFCSPSQAIDIFETVVSEYPKSADSAQACAMIATISELMGEEKDAESEWIRVASDFPNSSLAERASLNIERLYAERKDFDKGVRVLSDMAKAHRGTRISLAAWLSVGRLLSAKGDDAGALEAYGKAAGLDAENAGSAMLAIGKLHQSQGIINEAIAAYHKAIESAGNSKTGVDAVTAIKDICLAHGWSDDNIMKALVEVVSKYPQTEAAASAQSLIGKMYLDKNEVDLAEKAFLAIAEQYPPTSSAAEDAKYWLAEINFQKAEKKSEKGDTWGELEALKLALKYFSLPATRSESSEYRMANALMRVADILVSFGKTDEAIDYLHYLQANPVLAFSTFGFRYRALLKEVDIYIEKADYQKALRCLSRLDDGYVSAFITDVALRDMVDYKRAVIYCRMENYQTAIDILKELTKEKDERMKENALSLLRGIEYKLGMSLLDDE